jgi:transcriptional regulator with XRE-family HTH domain
LGVTSTDDDRTGRLLRVIRRRVGLTQAALAARAGVPRRDVIRIEAGLVGSVSLDRIRSIFEATDGRARLSTWWQGAAADRLLDERHAALVEKVVALFERRGWETAVEVSFSRFGERGSIDVLGGLRDARAVAVVEIKSAFGSLEETNRTLDMKERLAPSISEQRFGFRPAFVGRVLVVPSDDSIRRVVARHERTMGSIYPARSHDVRRWLRRPDGPIRAIWFIAEVRDRDPISG